LDAAVSAEFSLLILNEFWLDLTIESNVADFPIVRPFQSLSLNFLSIFSTQRFHYWRRRHGLIIIAT